MEEDFQRVQTGISGNQVSVNVQISTALLKPEGGSDVQAQNPSQPPCCGTNVQPCRFRREDGPHICLTGRLFNPQGWTNACPESQPSSRWNEDTGVDFLSTTEAAEVLWWGWTLQRCEAERPDPQTQQGLGGEEVRPSLWGRFFRPGQ